MFIDGAARQADTLFVMIVTLKPVSEKSVPVKTLNNYAQYYVMHAPMQGFPIRNHAKSLAAISLSDGPDHAVYRSQEMACKGNNGKNWLLSAVISY